MPRMGTVAPEEAVSGDLGPVLPLLPQCGTGGTGNGDFFMVVDLFKT